MTNNDDNVRRQAAHFDEKEPISPWPEVLRVEGFRYQYIAKDLVIKKALDGIAPNKGSRVLDVGCGTGIWLDRLGSSYGTVGTGVDISRQSLAKARSRSVRQSGFMLAEATALPIADGSFDLIVSLDVLEHIEQPQMAIDEMIRVASHDAHIMVYVVSRQNAYTFQWFERKLLTAIGIDLHPLACHDPNLLVDPKIIRDRLSGQNVILEKLEFFHAFFTSLYDRTLLVTYFIFKKLGLLNVRNRPHRVLAVIFLAVTSWISRFASGALVWLDQPWLKRGYANGFLAVARRIRPQIEVLEPIERTDYEEMAARGTGRNAMQPEGVGD